MLITVQTVPRAIDQGGDFAAVVVDVLRATTVISLAIEFGASQIITCREIDEAQVLASKISPKALLCGERFCKPIAGFDVGNSPADYKRELIIGRTLVMTTTNGTRALAAAQNAKSVYAGSFLNLSAVATKVSDETRITIVCAGTDGEETEEDTLFAGALVERLHQFIQSISLDDAAQQALDTWHKYLNESMSLAEKLVQSRGGLNLVAAGYRADIDACTAIDSVTAVPMLVSRDPITLKRSPR